MCSKNEWEWSGRGVHSVGGLAGDQETNLGRRKIAASSVYTASSYEVSG
jgi:hypothetical protein